MAPTTTQSVRWLTSPEMRGWRAFVIGSTRLTESFDRDLAPHGLSMADYEVLAHLSEAPGRRLRMSELAEISLISRSRLSHRMKVLESAGWVTREVCVDDRRGFFAVMTEEGWSKIVSAAPDHVRSVRRHLIDVLTPAELEVLAGAFEKVIASLRTTSEVCSE